MEQMSVKLDRRRAHLLSSDCLQENGPYAGASWSCARPAKLKGGLVHIEGLGSTGLEGREGLRVIGLRGGRSKRRSKKRVSRRKKRSRRKPNKTR